MTPFFRNIFEKDIAFKLFERSGWDQVAYEYHQLWGAMTQQAVPQLLASTKIENGDQVMDLATGAGYAANQTRKLGLKWLSGFLIITT